MSSLQQTSRTAKSLQNVKVAFAFYLINLILQFFSRKIFLDYLGSEVLGLNTTAQNLLGFLNLAELGIGGAVAYNLYKPLFENNRQAINDIVSIQGWLYRRIAYIVIAGSVILMCFFPWIFAKAQVPLWYTYGSFIALLASSLLGYFVNYRQIVLSADQKEYKITFNVQGVKVIKVLLQMLAIWQLTNGYVYWMILEVIMAVVTSLVLDKAIRKEYPWLNPQISQGSALQRQYPEIIRKTKQVFFHKIGGFVLSQTSPLIIYAYASLTLVAVYGNYMLIVTGVTTLMGALLNGVNAGIGNLVAEGNKQHIKKVYWEITLLRMWIASVICFGMLMLGDPFISLWVGEAYILPHTAFIILIINTFINLTRTNDSFIAAYGIFQDVWAPVVEATLNLGCSILLGHFFGLEGILGGVFISLLLIICSWKPYFLYRYGFKEPIVEYIRRYVKYIAVIVLLFIACSEISNCCFITPASSYVQWIAYGIKVLALYVILSAMIFALTDKTARNLLGRIYKFIHKSKK